MPSSTPFRLNRTGLLLALISTAFAGQAQAAAGRVEFAMGPATVVGVDGRSRSATRGTELDSGDVVRTNDGRVQMRMTDGAFISLQPNTEFGIKEYKFAGKADGSENAFYSLVKGAMRTVTGLIGRVNRNRYQVATPTATVGIRGTGGLIEILQGGATLVQGTSGIWFLANPAGTIDIPAGVAGLAPVDPKQPPKETVQIPTAGPSPLPALIEFVQGEEREDDGKNVLTAGVLSSGDGYVAALAYSAESDGVLPELQALQGSAVFSGAGQLTEFSSSDLRASFLYRLESGGSHAEFGTDGILAWGRWIGPVTTPDSFSGTESYGANQGLHYVIGMPTPSMPQSGPATYTLIGATSPTDINGIIAPGTFSGTMSVTDWSTGVITMDLNVDMPAAGLGYLINGDAQFSGSAFSGSFVKGQGVIGTNLNSCASSCSAGVEGFISGATGERAGVAYHINDNGSLDIVGAAAFTIVLPQ
jgi:hypothetical protein